MRKKMSKTHCTFVEKGMFVSHRGASLCCIHPDKQLIKPSDFWSGETRKTALDHMKNDQKVTKMVVLCELFNLPVESSYLFLNLIFQNSLD